LSPLATALTDDESLAGVLDGLARAAAEIGTLVRYPEPHGPELSASVGQTPEGDDQKALDLMANDITVAALANTSTAAIGSEEVDDPILVNPDGRWVVVIDPLDGSDNIEINAPMGFIFGVLPATDDPARALLQPGMNLEAAGAVVFGPSTAMLATAGKQVDLFVLDADDQWTLSRSGLTIAPKSSTYAINASNYRHWSPGYQAYYNDLIGGAEASRQRDFNTRWIGALVADLQRIFARGGIYLYPNDRRDGYGQGRIRLVYEANPVAMLCETAGGSATDGRHRILELVPNDLHQRTPLVFGSADEVELVGGYLATTKPEPSPLFGRRGFFRSV
jgi:fructose-1,6-bisphosphatase I